LHKLHALTGMLRNVHEKRLIPDFMENTIAPFIGFHGLCLQQERGMEQDSYHRYEKTVCGCAGVRGLWSTGPC